jgi:hypothetical protein
MTFLPPNIFSMLENPDLKKMFDNDSSSMVKVVAGGEDRWPFLEKGVRER